MKVVREALDGTPIQQMVVEDPREADVPKGSVVGYLCPECLQADETLEQIWHDEACSHAGQHGRAYYDDIEPDVPGRPTPELDPRHPITVIVAGETEGYGGLCEGEVLAFRCRCGNADEDLFEIRHDEDCELAGRFDRSTDPEIALADGGGKNRDR